MAQVETPWSRVFLSVVAIVLSTSVHADYDIDDLDKDFKQAE